LMKLFFAVLDVSLTMGLTRCYKTEGFLHLLILTGILSRTVSKLSQIAVQSLDEKRSLCIFERLDSHLANLGPQLRWDKFWSCFL